jgi:uncharacterized OB-fold protein
MTVGPNTAVPADLARAVEAHGKAVAAGDNSAVLADFLPDRIGQLIASANVPPVLKGAQVLNITAAGDGRYDAIIRYTKPDDQWFELRSRWVRFTDGSWRVFSVRNIPETPPWINITGPSPDGLDAPHWDGLRAGKLLLQRCRQCATWTWSPRPICPACHSLDIGWEPVDPLGTIYSWTRTWQPFAPESTGHLPYVVVLVELPAAGGCRVLGVLAHADGVTPRIGDQVRGEIEQPPDNDHWPLVRWHLREPT